MPRRQVKFRRGKRSAPEPPVAAAVQDEREEVKVISSEAQLGAKQCSPNPKKPKEEEEKKEPISAGPPKPTIEQKPYTIHESKIARITNWIEVPVKELRDYCDFEILHEKIDPQDFVCPICRMEYYDNMFALSPDEVNKLNEEMITGKKEIPVVLLSKCQNHFYHKECIEKMAESSQGSNGSLKCPVCSTIYGVLFGDMPNGHMYVKVIPGEVMRCVGYNNCDTLVISYSIFDGVRDGIKFNGTILPKIKVGTMREGYLPNNAEGHEVLRLLRLAFERRLTFTVGTSVTTGATNGVVWNGIHHKTSLRGGPTRYGYPDPKYFNRVKEELAAKGVNAGDS